MHYCQFEEMMFLRVLVLRSAPNFLRGRLLENFGMALRDRFRDQLHEDRDGEIRAWNLFALTPIFMLLHKPKRIDFVGRSELVHRADMFPSASVACSPSRRVSVHPRKGPSESRQGSPESGATKSSLQSPSRIHWGHFGSTGFSHTQRAAQETSPSAANGNPC